VAAMADTHGSPESFGSKVFDHHSARSRHQSVEELNANSSTQVREARTDPRRVAAREGGGAIAGFGKLTGTLCSHDSRHHSSKEKHGEGEKRMANSPMQRRRAQAHQQAPTTTTVKPRVLNPSTLEITWTGSVLRWKKGRGGTRLHLYSLQHDVKG
jgi:hypothetical protein